MIESQARQLSQEALLTSLQQYLDAGGAIVQIRTREPLRAALVLREHFACTGIPYHEWSAAMGIRRFTSEDFVDHTKKGAPEEVDFVSAFQRPLAAMRDAQSEVRARSEVTHYFAYLDPGPHIANNPYVLDLIQQYAAILPTSNVAILFITPNAPLDSVPQGLMLTTELPTPSVPELELVINQLLNGAPLTGKDSEKQRFKNDLSQEDTRRAAVLGLGLTLLEFESHVSLSIIAASTAGCDCVTLQHLIDGISTGKTEVVRQSEILELLTPGRIEDVGGMDRLKTWVKQRESCYSEEAKAFGVEPPKGVVLVGVPGSGKSLVAKAIAASFGIPLVRLDFGRVFSKYIGDSESRVRSALSMVEAMAPCVLFVDEVDKGLGGIGTGGDSGTSMRVLGSYLTWLQELRAPVFNIVTANQVQGLPPELLRRGRFDQVFSVGLPDASERQEVLRIHLRRRGYDIGQFAQVEIQRFLSASEGYVPAEIESCVKDALIAAFNANEDLGMSHILQAIQDTIPMSKSHADRINSILEWARNNAISVSRPPPIAVSAGPGRGRRVIVNPHK